MAKVVTTLNSDGDIVRLAPLASLTIAEQDGRPSPRVDRIQALLADTGIDAGVSTDIVAAMWHKWVFITTVGALTCLMRGTVGDVNAVPGGSASVPPSSPRPLRWRRPPVSPSRRANSPPPQQR